MKLIDAIKQVDRDDRNSHDPDLSDFCQELGINDTLGWSEEFNKRMRAHPLIKWICTDTWVGVNVYYLDDEPVAISQQNARKSDTYYHFMSKEAAGKIRDFILSLTPVEENDRISIIDENEEIDETYTLSFSGQLLTKEGFVDGKSCVVTNTFRENYISKSVEVLFEDGTKKIVSIEEFHIPLSLTPKNQMKPPTFAPVYLSLFPHISKIANDKGYALAAHGSVQRDMDLVAIPWTEDASDAETLMRAIGEYLKVFNDIWGTELFGPTEKPHGRVSWLLSTGFGSGIDLSVMPRSNKCIE